MRRKLLLRYNTIRYTIVSERSWMREPQIYSSTLCSSELVKLWRDVNERKVLFCHNIIVTIDEHGLANHNTCTRAWLCTRRRPTRTTALRHSQTSAEDVMFYSWLAIGITTVNTEFKHKSWIRIVNHCMVLNVCEYTKDRYTYLATFVRNELTKL